MPWIGNSEFRVVFIIQSAIRHIKKWSLLAILIGLVVIFYQMNTDDLNAHSQATSYHVCAI